MAEDKTFDIKLGGVTVAVPYRLKFGHAREVWKAIDYSQDSSAQICGTCKTESVIDRSDFAEDSKVKAEDRRVYAVCKNPQCPRVGERRLVRFRRSVDLDNKNRFVAAATGKPMIWLDTNSDPEEIDQASDTIMQEWTAAGFFGQVQPVKVTISDSNSGTGEPSTTSPKPTAGVSPS